METKRIESKEAARLNWPDASRAFIHDDGRWELTLPGGKHLRGKAANVTLAQAAVEEARNRWIMKMWNQGVAHPLARLEQGWLCPLT